MFIKSSFDEKENKLDYYRGEDCNEEICKKNKQKSNGINLLWKKKD